MGFFDRFREPAYVQPRSCFPDPTCPYGDAACVEEWLCADCTFDLILGRQARPIELAELQRGGDRAADGGSLARP